MGIKETIGKFIFDYVKKQVPDFKEFLLAKLEEAKEDLIELLNSEKVEEAVVKVVDDVLDKINLPWFVKPFKGLLKKEIIKQCKNFVTKLGTTEDAKNN